MGHTPGPWDGDEAIWHVSPGGQIRYAVAGLYVNARDKILGSRRLRPHLYTILAEGLAGDEDHLRRVIESPVSETERWATQTKGRQP